MPGLSGIGADDGRLSSMLVATSQQCRGRCMGTLAHLPASTRRGCVCWRCQLNSIHVTLAQLRIHVIHRHPMDSLCFLAAISIMAPT